MCALPLLSWFICIFFSNCSLSPVLCKGDLEQLILVLPLLQCWSLSSRRFMPPVFWKNLFHQTWNSTFQWFPDSSEGSYVSKEFMPLCWLSFSVSAACSTRVSVFLPATLACFDLGHSHRCEVASHCYSDIHFLNVQIK